VQPSCIAKETQVASHVVVQQVGENMQTAVVHVSQPSGRAAPATHGEWAHVPPLVEVVVLVVLVVVVLLVVGHPHAEPASVTHIASHVVAQQ
jgi:hypothetical protein